ncbi:MAG: hypothetical protein AB8A46_07660 [Prochlorococcus sp.]
MAMRSSRWLGCLGLSISGLAFASACYANTWDQIARYSNILRGAGTETLVARDCPAALMGAFHVGRNAVLLCANNLDNDPVRVWTVLAHESAHVMQSCKEGPLLADHQFSLALSNVQERSPQTMKELRLYAHSQQREEVEARLVQELSDEKVISLFQKFCADRLNKR